MAEEKDAAELRGLGARWRPVVRLDTVKEPLLTVESHECVDRNW
jgi:hypothetical protein